MTQQEIQTKDFTKSLRPGMVDVGRASPVSLFVTVEYSKGRLSITGVEGPRSNGDCAGSCGQCRDSLSTVVEYAPGWDAATVERLARVWDDWHLNDMRAYDSEMEAAGWPELAKREILIYEYSLTRDVSAAADAAKAAALAALKAGETFTPAPEQAKVAAMPYFLKVYQYPENGEPSAPEGYQRARSISRDGGSKHPERKTLGWIRPSEHPDGLLGRKLRDDGPGYGSARFKQDVPPDVLEWLAALPDADRSNPWKR